MWVRRAQCVNIQEQLLTEAVTLLSILAAHSIALPLSPAFPASELQYILDHSQASMLLSSAKFDAKAQEVLDTGLQGSPKSVRVVKKLGGAEHTSVELEGGSDCGKGGMMLYTSGTTATPVSMSNGGH